MAGIYCQRKRGGSRETWNVERIWELAKGLPVERVAIDSIGGFDEVTWFDAEGRPPTCRRVAEHAKRILACDLAHPVILSDTGGVMDGMHRIAKAWMLGHTHVAAVRFPVNPPPDKIEP